jgi:DNA-binding response OmpR family regulator
LEDLLAVLAVLVVEDEVLIQGVLKDVLNDGGFAADIAGCGEDAVRLLVAPEPKYRALVTDIDLGFGRLDGWQVARRARDSIQGFLWFT